VVSLPISSPDSAARNVVKIPVVVIVLVHVNSGVSEDQLAAIDVFLFKHSIVVFSYTNIIIIFYSAK